MDVLINAKGGVIDVNFDDAKAYLDEQLKMYEAVVFTEDTKKDAKDTVAQLRKDKKALQDRVKDVKKEYMKPFDDFYSKAVELIEMYDKPIDYINNQIANFEALRLEEKRKLISSFYNEIIPEDEWRKVLPLDRIYNTKWENATASNKSIKEEMMQYKENAKAAYTSIKAMHSDKEAEALAMYNRNFNLVECIDCLNRYEEQKREVLEAERERERKEAEERIRAEERAKIEAEQKQAQEIEKAQAEAYQQAQQDTINSFIPEDNENVDDYSYMIRLSKDSKEKLEMYMDSVGIEYFVL